MKFSWNIILQGIGIAIQGANQILDLVPPRIKPAVVLGIGAAQAVIAFLAHFSNPDGTNAKAPYIPQP